MKKQWRQILLAASSAVGSMIVAALLAERQEQAEAPAPQAAKPVPVPQRHSLELLTKRDMAINFLSDLLAETYRKIRAQQTDRDR